MRIRHLFALLTVCVSLTAFAQKAALDNTAKPAQQKGYHTWTVFVKANDPVLNAIDHVEYLLDPTFPKPQVAVYERNNNFSYTATGWSGFEIKAKVVYKNKTSEYIKYWLKL